MAEANRIDQEIIDSIATARQMIDAYVGLKATIQYDTYNTMYGEIIDFANFRMETATSCLTLVEANRVADSLGLCRSLLENYLLLKLLCRGTKYFQLQTFESLTEAEFKNKLAEVQQKNEEDRSTGKSSYLEVEAYPRAKRHIMYVFEGLKDQDTPEFMIPIHYFQFKEFHPETMRLKDEDYFVYYEQPADLKKARKAHMQEATFRYRHYLSYDALLVCLGLNDLADKGARARIDAHYTFLGKFLHPTFEAARDLHVRSNVHTGDTGVGMNQEYSATAKLLATLYVCHLLADIIDEISLLFESAPSSYVKNVDTSALRDAAAHVRTRFPYFWFIYNEPSLYDKFICAIHGVSDNDLKRYGGYTGIPPGQVAFNQHIYGQLQSALRSWNNDRVGSYNSPLD